MVHLIRRLGFVTLICIGELVIIGWDNGLAQIRNQAII